MSSRMLGADRVMLLLSMVAFLREHGPTPVTELAAAFDVTPKLARSLFRFLGEAGIPGETMTYQHEDLFDIDWDGLENADIASLTHTVAVEEAPRFSSVEAATLVAGLQALIPALDSETAELAQRLAAKLGSGLAESVVPISLAPSAADARISVIADAIASQHSLRFAYRDLAGKRSERWVDPLVLEQQEADWYLRAYCRDRQAERLFRVGEMTEMRQDAPVSQPPIESRGSRPAERLEPIVARVRPWAVRALRRFSPVTLTTEDEWVRVRIENWHRGAAVRLVQMAPGGVVIESPSEGRAAVASWARSVLEESETSRDSVSARGATSADDAEIH